MKKIISLLLCMVMIFSFAMPSFASSHTSELDALNSIDNWSESIWQVLTNKIAAELDLMADDLDLIATRNYTMLSYLLDISDFTRSTYQEIEAFTDSFFNEVSWGEPFAEVVQDRLDSIDSSVESLAFLVSEIPGTLSNINSALITLHGLGASGWEDYEDSWFLAVYNDVHQLKEVLADDEDLLYKESQKANQESAFNSFFSSSSGTSLSPSSFTDLSTGFDDFAFYLQGYEEDSSNYLVSAFQSGLSLLRGEDFTDTGFSPLGWFSEATANDISRVQSTFSRDSSSQIVTDYYSQQQDLYLSFFGRGD